MYDEHCIVTVNSVLCMRCTGFAQHAFTLACCTPTVRFTRSIRSLRGKHTAHVGETDTRTYVAH